MKHVALRLLYVALGAAIGAVLLFTSMPSHATEVCRWDRPGADPYIGSVPAAVDNYVDIPAEVRAKLRARMERREYDDLVDIRRDTIRGRYDYDPTIRGMHFGKGRVCETVTRARWLDDTHERGLVYCENSYCVMVPTVCRNVSRIVRLTPPLAHESVTFEQLATLETPAMLPPPSVAPPPETFAGPAPAPAYVSAFPSGGFITVPHDVPVTPVPEPSTWALLVAGLALLLWQRERRK